MKFTHKKRTYYATCLQWDGTTQSTAMVIELLDRAGCEAHKYGNELMLRWKDDWHRPSIECMKVGSWLRLGENDKLKVMTAEEFDAKYEAI